MIEITKAYKTEDGQTFPTIKEAQQYELECLCKDAGSSKQTIEVILAHADKVIAILKIKPRKARAVKVKKCKTVLHVPK